MPALARCAAAQQVTQLRPLNDRPKKRARDRCPAPYTTSGMQVLSAAATRPVWVGRPLAARAGRLSRRRPFWTRAQAGGGGLTEEGRQAATRGAADRFKADQL